MVVLAAVGVATDGRLAQRRHRAHELGKFTKLARTSVRAAHEREHQCHDQDHLVASHRECESERCGAERASERVNVNDVDDLDVVHSLGGSLARWLVG